MYDDETPSLADLRLAAIEQDLTVTVRRQNDDDDPSFSEANLFYVDVSDDRGAAILEALLGRDGVRLFPGRNSYDDSGGDDTVAQFRDGLEIAIIDVSGARAANPDFDIDLIVSSLGFDDAELDSPVSPVTVYTKAPWGGGPFGPPIPTTPPLASILPAPHTSPPRPGPIRFAVVDTGFPDGLPGSHPHLENTVDLSDSAVDSPVYVNVALQQLLMDAGHGLFIWDIAYRLDAGLAPAFMPRVTRDDTGVTLSEIAIIGVLEALVKKVVTDAGGQLLVNMSFSGTTPNDKPPKVFGTALAKLEGLDVLVVAAAGNDSSDRPHWPAAFATSHPSVVVSVGALDADSDSVAEFSNRGPWVEAWSVGTGLDAAYLPGTLIPPLVGEFPTTVGEEPWAIWQGTSFAAPRIAAAIANQAASMSSCPTLFEAWTALQTANTDYHPTWLDGSLGLHTENGVIIN
jgi:hypothetical protein